MAVVDVENAEQAWKGPLRFDDYEVRRPLGRGGMSAALDAADDAACVASAWIEDLCAGMPIRFEEPVATIDGERFSRLLRDD